MKKFWKWAVILMTATMAAGLATSCEEKGNTEPVTIRKTWLAFDEEYGDYVGYDLGSINGKLCLIETFVTNEEDAEKYSQMFEVEISVNDILYVDMESAIGASLEITETDATSGWIRFSELVTIEYKNLTKDSVTLIYHEDDATIEYEARTPEGWGLTVNNYIDITSAAIQ
ncbi:MAG: hypothetical protein IAB75_02580 [Bacteroidetes bacterium]|uniref:Lipoprotein n=1 Tax=Candidatus Cryptobacteroides avicola TaxID=2840757 RepID=A0A940DQT5_9BACT|nr:hypothetical protein [Candidatus Cryptobacteroides avicola]